MRKPTIRIRCVTNHPSKPTFLISAVPVMHPDFNHRIPDIGRLIPTTSLDTVLCNPNPTRSNHVTFKSTTTHHMHQSHPTNTNQISLSESIPFHHKCNHLSKTSSKTSISMFISINTFTTIKCHVQGHAIYTLKSESWKEDWPPSRH